MNTVTLKEIEAKVKKVDWLVMPDGRTTICQITLENGFTVNGESACVDINNFNAELGEKYAYDAAVSKIGVLEGYLLAQRLYEEKT